MAAKSEVVGLLGKGIHVTMWVCRRGITNTWTCLGKRSILRNWWRGAY